MIVVNLPAACSWYENLVTGLQRIGFEQYDRESFILNFMSKTTYKVRVILVVNANDMVIAGSSSDCERLQTILSRTFPVNISGPLTWYTG